MPLNKVKGESIGDLGDKYIVVSNDKWRESALFNDAATAAAQAFLKSGALWPITFDDEEVLTQEYPQDNKLVILFTKTIRGAKHLYPYVFDIPPEMIAELRAIGKWTEYTEH